MSSHIPRITARVDTKTQELLQKATAISGISSINSFVLNAAIEKAQKIIEDENKLQLISKDAIQFIEALDTPQENPRLTKAIQNYYAK